MSLSGQRRIGDTLLFFGDTTIRINESFEEKESVPYNWCGVSEANSTKRAVFTILMFAGVLGFLEATGAVLYYLVIPRQRRVVVETALGIRDPELNSVAPTMTK